MKVVDHILIMDVTKKENIWAIPDASNHHIKYASVNYFGSNGESNKLQTLEKDDVKRNIDTNVNLEREIGQKVSSIKNSDILHLNLDPRKITLRTAKSGYQPGQRHTNGESSTQSKEGPFLINKSFQSDEVKTIELKIPHKIDMTVINEQCSRRTTKLPVLISHNNKKTNSCTNFIKNSMNVQQWENTNSDTKMLSRHNYQVDNYSTSPESILDNILSVASSLSIQSDALSNHNIIAEINNVNNTKINHEPTGNTSTVTTNYIKNRKSNIPVIKVEKENSSYSTTSHNKEARSPKYPNLSITSLDSYKTATNRSSIFNDGSSISSTVPEHNSKTAPETMPLVYLSDSDLKCCICNEMYTDPRILNCLHTFCLKCLWKEYSVKDTNMQPGQQVEESINNNSKYMLTVTDTPSDTITNVNSKSFQENDFQEQHFLSTATATTSLKSRNVSSTQKWNKKSIDRISSSPIKKIKTEQTKMNKNDGNNQFIKCKLCQYPTHVPDDDFKKLPSNYLILHKLDAYHLQLSKPVISRVWCSLCYDQNNATYHCLDCVLNLCTLCKESHERQRSTTNHKISNIMDLKKEQQQQKQQGQQRTEVEQQIQSKYKNQLIKCSLHPSYFMKFYCLNCLQVICSDCLMSLHRKHKCEPIIQVFQYYLKILNESIEKTRLLCNYAMHSLQKYNDITKNINHKCDDIEKQIELHITNYYEALNAHSNILLQQIRKARESKIEMLLEQQMDLEKRTKDASTVIQFTKELTEMATDIEVLTLLRIIMKRFQHCQQFQTPIDPKISDTIQFLPDAQAPCNKNQNGILLYGVITMQSVDPSLCTLQWGDFSQLRINKKVELTILTRDTDDKPFCHGGLDIKCKIQYKEMADTRIMPVEIQDNRDGTYTITFTPDSEGILIVSVFINKIPIKDNPYTFLVRSVRPHTGIFHCCTFCSSKGNKTMQCSCNGRMPGYSGCGHGHAGHPGRRHWSCCANVEENSECRYANKSLNTSN